MIQLKKRTAVKDFYWRDHQGQQVKTTFISAAPGPGNTAVWKWELWIATVCKLVQAEELQLHFRGLFEIQPAFGVCKEGRWGERSGI